MVTFKELVTSNQKYLLIADRDDDTAKNRTQLLVHAAIHGNYVGNWPSHNYPHLDEWSSEDFHAVRPSTFKVASLMASGRRTCLAMLILLSIYRGLNKMAQAPILGQSHASFPMHYVYAWSAHYFHTHYTTPSALPTPMMTNNSGESGAQCFDENNARDLIQKGNKVTWWATSLVKNQNKTFLDNGDYQIWNLVTSLACTQITWFCIVKATSSLNYTVCIVTKRCLSSIVVKANELNATNSHEERRGHSYVDEDEHSNNSEHWKRKKKKKQAAKISSHLAKLATINCEEAELKKQLDLLDAQRKETLPLLQKNQEELSQMEINIVNLQEEVNQIENSSPLDAEESKTSKKMRKLLESGCQELETFELKI
ncbi:hypothetical protein ACH5RR_015611 [Cinchona calisaya]|uniref:Uncharacterized protein n=1 Tax=Cinchona calisaya TaxID=153742 RepID=A0ABD2ZTN0_9GENT